MRTGYHGKRYTSDGTGDIRFINDQERKSIYELEDIEKSVHKLEQLLKIGNKEEISEFLNDMLSNKNRDEINYLIIQILATAHRCVSVLSDNDALSELFSSNILSPLACHSILTSSIKKN